MKEKLLAVAIDLIPCATTRHPNPCTLADFFTLVANVIRFLVLNLAVPAATITIFIAGFMYLTTSIQDQRNKAKSLFKMAGWGLVLALAAQLIVQTIANFLIKPGTL
ncbi:MAG: pilin [Patescibacteria group bacterium]